MGNYIFGQRLEVVRDLDAEVAKVVKDLDRLPEENWQPDDFLPDLGAPDGIEKLLELQKEAANLPADVMAVLVGNTITEEALPTYSSWIFTQEGVGEVGANRTPWTEWGRIWCAEEKRHGDILADYLQFCGRINMKEVQITIQHLIRDGMDIQTSTDPFRFFVYTSFQEEATQISHRRIGEWARDRDAPVLNHLSRRMAGDEGRHATAYRKFISQIFQRDPSEMMLAFYEMMRQQITMPAMNMRESYGEISEAFKKFEVVAQRSGIYTAVDYVQIIKNLLRIWDIEHIGGLTPEAAKAQEYLCKLPQRYEKIVSRKKVTNDENFTFKWLK